MFTRQNLTPQHDDPKILIWLPGSEDHRQHQRMRQILRPFAEALRLHSFRAVFRSMLADDFAEARSQINIWLATDLGEAPPAHGLNILWFLNQMKVMSQSALAAYDGVMTQSSQHAMFLSRWFGDAYPVAQIGWPVDMGLPHDDSTRVHDFLDLDAGENNPQEHKMNIEALQAGSGALTSLFCAYREVRSVPPLRERMCGFHRFEELIALLSGCGLVSDVRKGLPDALMKLMDMNRDARRSAEQTQARRVLLQACSPERLANLCVDLIGAVQSRSIAPERIPVDTSDAQSELPDASIEIRAFLRDRAQFLRVVQGFTEDALRSLHTPWLPGLGQGQGCPQPDLPWTDLSFALTLLERTKSGQHDLASEDRRRLGAMAAILKRYDPQKANQPIDLRGLPDVPWRGVSVASRDPVRDYNDLSRALNGHCLFRFLQSTRKSRVLVSALPAISSKDIVHLSERTGIVLHAYYLDTARAILTYLAGCMRSWPLCITTDDIEKSVAIAQLLSELDWQNAEITVVPNKGRDILPKLIHAAHAHASCDYVLHLHTKRSPHTKNLAEWGNNALQGLASRPALHRIQQAFSEDPQLGMIYATPPKLLWPAMSWLRNLRLAEMLAHDIGIKHLPTSEALDFPVGSMFWARRSAIASLLSTRIGTNHFAPEAGQEDGTLAHAIERFLGVICQSNGFTLARSEI